MQWYTDVCPPHRQPFLRRRHQKCQCDDACLAMSIPPILTVQYFNTHRWLHSGTSLRNTDNHYAKPLRDTVAFNDQGFDNMRIWKGNYAPPEGRRIQEGASIFVSWNRDRLPRPALHHIQAVYGMPRIV